jgi:TetR/AcrR family transcriptional regulator, transcriptional repressor for nem operon
MKTNMKKQKTKHLLLEKGAEIMQLKGFHSTGIQEIVNACKVPKGSFYYYFDSKEIFGLELINYFAEKQLTQIDLFFNDLSVNPKDRIENYFSNFFEEFAKNDFKGGSFMGNFIQELAAVNEMLRQGLVIVNEEIIDRFAKIIHEINPDISPIGCRKKAELLYFTFEGITMQVKLYKTTEPAKNMINNIESF